MAAMLLELAGTSPHHSENPPVPADLDIASGVPEVPSVVTVWTSEGNEELAKSHLNVADTVGRVDVRIADEDADKAKRTRKTRSDKGKTRKAATPDVGPLEAEAIREKIKTVGGQDGEIDLNAVREKLDAIKDQQAKREMINRLAEPVTDPNRDPVELPAPAVETSDLPDAKAVVEAVVSVKTDKVEMEGSIDEALTAIDPAKPDGDLITDEQVARLRELRVEAAKLDVYGQFREIIVKECGAAGSFTEIPLAVANELLPKLDKCLAEAEEGQKVAE